MNPLIRSFARPSIAAMASCANQYKWCAPTLCESNCIRIKVPFIFSRQLPAEG